jgi:hypothetical protein
MIKKTGPITGLTTGLKLQDQNDRTKITGQKLPDQNNRTKLHDQKDRTHYRTNATCSALPLPERPGRSHIPAVLHNRLLS